MSLRDWVKRRLHSYLHVRPDSCRHRRRRGKTCLILECALADSEILCGPRKTKKGWVAPLTTASGRAYGLSVMWFDIYWPLTCKGMNECTARVNAGPLFNVMHVVEESINVVQMWFAPLWKQSRRGEDRADAGSSLITDQYHVITRT